MVAIMVAALLGAGFSTLALAPFGGWAVLLGIPVMGSLAALACAGVIYVISGRHERAENEGEKPLAKPLRRVADGL